MMREAAAWIVGVDWGSEKHQVCVLDGYGAIVGERVFLHSGAGLADISAQPGASQLAYLLR